MFVSKLNGPNYTFCWANKMSSRPNDDFIAVRQSKSKSVHHRMFTRKLRNYSTKMEILKWNRQVFKIFGMCSLDEGSEFWLKIGQIISVSFILLNFYSLEWFSALYIVDHYQMGDIDRNLFVLIQTIGTVPSIASFISLVYRKTSVREYFDRIQTIFDKCMWASCFNFSFKSKNEFEILDQSSPSARIYIRTNELCEKFIKWAIVFIGTSYVASTIVPIIIGVIFYWIKDGHVETKSLYLPLKMRYSSDCP